MGIFWGLCSVIITSAAQLSLGFAMDNLPPVMQPLAFISAVFSLSIGAFALSAGLAGYLLSVICWHKALHQLALSKAYALLSLSYVLVWVASMILPGWRGRHTAGRGGTRDCRTPTCSAGLYCADRRQRIWPSPGGGR